MKPSSVIVQKQGRAGRLTLNRPDALHALNSEMVTIMTRALAEWEHDPEVELVIVDHAPGTKGFCAGGDVRMLAESGAKGGREAAAFFAREYRLNTLIHEYPKPYIAMMDGITMGGGVGVSVHGSHRIATNNTVFAMPEAGIGLFPDVGGSWFLPRLRGELGLWLALTGTRLKGRDVLAAGIATHFSGTDTISALTEALSNRGLSAIEALETQACGTFEPYVDEIDQAFSRASIESMLTALSRGSDWSRCQAHAIEANSPLSLKIALRQLRAGGAMVDFRDCMAMEYRIATRLVRTRNFLEGVRAALIDRDHAPVWAPVELATVSDDLLKKFFAPLGSGELNFDQELYA